MILSYKLAKKLKDAGFPQKDNMHKMHQLFCAEEKTTIEGARDMPMSVSPFGEEVVCVPTLSELIDACGDIFCGVHKLATGGWIAFIMEDSTRQVDGEGSTPEEAVANLFLELHKQVI